MFKVPNQYRERTHPVLKSEDSIGNNGAFRVPISDGRSAFVIASSIGGWEHVSVHVIVNNKSETPTWDDMCFIKDLFWSDDDTVVQYHPKKSEYVNCHPNVLHLWKQTDVEFKLPPKIMV